MCSIEWNVVISIDLERTQSQVSRFQYFTNLISPMTLSNLHPDFKVAVFSKSNMSKWCKIKPCVHGSRPLVTPYYCSLGDLLCFVFMSAYCLCTICSFSTLILLVGSFDL